MTHDFAQRLETAEGMDGADCAEAQIALTPGSGAAVKAVAGGFLMFLGPESPLTHAVGIGMNGPVTEAELDEIEEFYQSRETPVTLDICPYVDSTLIELLGARRYRLGDFHTVLIKPIQPGDAVPECATDALVRVAEASEMELYTDTVTRGFFEKDDITPEERNLGRVIFRMARAQTFLAKLDGKEVAAGSLSVRNGIASCFGDSTLISHRRRGAHTALICARMVAAGEAGCDVITAGTHPGSTSQRDYVRLGFQVAYTRVTMILD